MNGLIRKDLYSLKGSLKITALLIAVFGIMFIQESGFPFIAVTIFIMATLVISTISLDETIKWDKYSLTLPISRKDIIRSKYALMLILSLIGMMIGLIISSAYSVIVSKTPLDNILLFAVLLFAVAVSLTSIALPIIYKIGADKGHIIAVVCIVLPIAAIIMLTSIVDTSIELMPLSDHVLTVGCLIISAAVFAMSYFTSMRIYANKDL